MNGKLRVLALENERGAESLRRHLESVHEGGVRFVHCNTTDEASRHLAEGTIDLIFLDHELGEINGCEYLRALRHGGRQEPVIVVTGRADPYIAAELTRAGADGFLVKKDLSPELLQSCIDAAMAEAEARRVKRRLAEHQRDAARHLAELNQELARVGRQDSLTGLMNRGAWEESLEVEAERSNRYGHSYSIVLLDVDHFKLLNDSQGHRAGDAVLKKVARCVSETCRKIDMVARYGGEEFIVLLPETAIEQATVLAERIRRAIFELNLPHAENRVANRVTASLGVAHSAAGNGAGADVVRRADQALYTAKEKGRNCVCAESAPAEAPSRRAGAVQRIIVVDDDFGDVELLRRLLEHVPGLHFELVHVCDLDGARRENDMGTADIVFLDYLLGNQSGVEVLKGFRADGFSGPIICLTGQGDAKIAAELMRHGADDYLVKADLDPEALRRAMENASTQHRRREVEADNRQLLAEVRAKNEELAAKNRRLAEMYGTAHEFVDNVSHEFRTPLTVIKEFASIMLDGLAGPTTDDQTEYLNTILNRVDDLATMIDDMLDISKLESGLMGIARRRVAPCEVIERVRSTLLRKGAVANVTVTIDSADGLPDVYCDPEKIGRVLINLCVNAIKFSPEGGRVQIWCRHEEPEAQLRFGVSDTGPGIDDASLAVIFERFRQLEGGARSSTKGFGLGLNIAKELVHVNFGEVDVQSALGKGSTFSFTVPRMEPSSLITRYIRDVPSMRNGASLVTLVEISAFGETAVDADNALERLLQHQLRRSDLLFPIGPARWVLAVASSRHETEILVRRIGGALEELKRNRPGGGLGGLDLSIGDEWDVLTEQDAFVARFLEAVHCTELVHA